MLSTKLPIANPIIAPIGPPNDHPIAPPIHFAKLIFTIVFMNA
jgi:hypothetical protein